MEPIDPDFLHAIAMAWANTSQDELEKAGVMQPNQIGGSDWKRFNNDPMMFIIKLPHDQRARLANMLTAKARRM